MAATVGTNLACRNWISNKSIPIISTLSAMTFHIHTDFTSQAGSKPINEDFCGAMLPGEHELSKGAIMAVADGVSRGGLGKEAAQTTVISLLRDYYGTPAKWDTTVALDRIIAAQNAWLAGQNAKRRPRLGMTTLTALVLRGHQYSVAHVGDSRAYLLRHGVLTQLTTDHVIDHVDFQHQLLRAIGLEERVAVDYVQGEMQVGDIFVLLTDGVHGSLRGRAIQDLLATPNPSEALVEAALQAGSQDNASALVVRVDGLDGTSMADMQRASHQLPIAPLLKVGGSLDGLVVQDVIADNGINVLYKVQDPHTHDQDSNPNPKYYALKTLHPARSHDWDERAMLVHEAWLAGSITSEHLVTLHTQAAGQVMHKVQGTPTSGQDRSAFYLLYDWLEGQSLERLLATQSAVDIPLAISMATQALKALAQLHRQGVIHRDIKPANLHWGRGGVLRVLDLGVALSGQEPASMRKLHAGTPSYVNPEQWGFSGLANASGGKLSTAQPVDELPDSMSDLFALGVTLYQLLTHKLPYGEVLPYQVGRYYRDPTAPTRHNGAIPIWLEHVMLKAVARDKRQRFETAEEFLLALERGASRPLNAPQATPLLARDPTAPWKLGLAVSLLFNFLLVYWLLFLPK
jgi:serine/threonine protein phosphatase PrpC/serine/threonine protein kinase